MASFLNGIMIPISVTALSAHIIHIMVDSGK